MAATRFCKIKTPFLRRAFGLLTSAFPWRKTLPIAPAAQPVAQHTWPGCPARDNLQMKTTTPHGSACGGGAGAACRPFFCYYTTRARRAEVFFMPRPGGRREKKKTTPGIQQAAKYQAYDFYLLRRGDFPTAGFPRKLFKIISRGTFLSSTVVQGRFQLLPAMRADTRAACYTTGWAAGARRTVLLRGKADARRPKARPKRQGRF